MSQQTLFNSTLLMHPRRKTFSNSLFKMNGFTIILELDMTGNITVIIEFLNGSNTCTKGFFLKYYAMGYWIPIMSLYAVSYSKRFSKIVKLLNLPSAFYIYQLTVFGKMNLPFCHKQSSSGNVISTLTPGIGDIHSFSSIPPSHKLIHWRHLI